MRRSFEQLQQGAFDVLVVGGGIYGAWIAYDASLRGLRVALVEKDDWGAGTSSASSKLIHGGLRYLAQREFGLVRAALAERRRLARLGPHRVWPLSFGLPVYEGLGVGRLKLRAGLWLYDRLAGADQPVPPHRSLSPAAFAERYSFLTREGLRGGFTFGDCQTDDARLTLEVVAGAMTAGAVAANRVEATRLVTDGSRVAGAELVDRETEERVEVRAQVTVNCSGPWIETLRGRTPARARLSKGVHLIFPSLPTTDGFLLPAGRDGRVIFLLPWYGRTILGTTDTDYTGTPDEPRIDRDDVEQLLGFVHRFLREPSWDETDLLGGYAGLRALPVTDDRSTAAVSREWQMVESDPGLLTSLGGKLTSARHDAEQAVDRVFKMLGKSPAERPTREQPFPWAPQAAYDHWRQQAILDGTAVGLDRETAATAAQRFGTRLDLVLERVRERPELGRRVVPDAPFCLAEIDHAARHEMARTLFDVLRRRVPLSLLAPPPRDVLETCADLVGDVLGWSTERRQHEIRGVQEHLPRPARAS